MIVLVILLSFSMDSLDYNEIGLNYSSFFKTVQKKTYTQGFHFLGLGHEFIVYPLNVQNIEFSQIKGRNLPPIQCRTEDGLNVELEISFQYRPLKEEIYNIYKTYGKKYEIQLLRTTVDSISDTSTRYSSYKFFTEKAAIAKDMFESLNKQLNLKQKVKNSQVILFSSSEE